MTTLLNSTGVQFNDGTTQLTSVKDFNYKNRVLNGDFCFNQRFGTGTVSHDAGRKYVTDRWSLFGTTGKVTATTVFTNSAPGLSSYLQLTSTSAWTPAAGEYLSLEYVVPGFHVQDFAFGLAGAKTISLSFWIRSSLTGTFGVSICSKGGARTWMQSYTINAANTWQYKTFTFTGDTGGTRANSGANWNYEDDVGMVIRINLGAGSTFTGATGGWNANNYLKPSGAVNLAGTSGATMQITGVQLEQGATATPFEYKPWSHELDMLEAYYQTVYHNKQYMVMFTPNGDTRMNNTYFPVIMRAAPTCQNPTFSNHSISLGQDGASVNNPTIGWQVQGIDSRGYNLGATTTTSGVGYPNSVTSIGHHVDQDFRFDADYYP